uniref:Uncharacterized protein MANES_16G050600 n=1 Tax=Rhizophora mucronata TaxID=61149 RepID=A0A2P2KBX4_RHIMU
MRKPKVDSIGKHPILSAVRKIKSQSELRRQKQNQGGTFTGNGIL